MKTRIQSPSRQKGFSLLTGFILSIIMFGTLAFFLAGQGINAGFGSTYSNTSKVSGLLASAGYINTGFDAIVLSGQLPTAVTFDATATTGVFNPTDGGAVPQEVDVTLIDTSLGLTTIYGYWVYRKNALTISGVGVPGTADYTMMVAGLKQGICQEINHMLHGSALATIPPNVNAGVFADINVVGPLAGPPSPAVPTNTGNALAVTSTWLNGCYTTSDNHYVYIHTLLAQ